MPFAVLGENPPTNNCDAIKHGISKLIKGGNLIINSKSDDTFSIMEIINSGQYEPSSLNLESASGFGIKNSIQRLQFIFGEKASLEINNRNKNEVLTKLKIPKS